MTAENADQTALIRTVRDQDGEAIAALIAAVFAEYPGCVFDWSEFPELRAPGAAFAALGGAMWVAAAQGIIGCVATAPGEGAWELFKLYVAREHRGSGLAPRLLETALAHAHAQGATRIVLWSDTRFLSGHRFYEKNGFARLPETRFLADLSNTYEYGFVRELA